MPISQYRLWAKAPAVRDQTQSRDIWDVGIHAIAKRSLTNHYELANEVIAARFGHAVALPIPPGAVVFENDNLYYCSLVFGQSGHELPPADTERLALTNPSLATGIVLFDSWICNPDRHEWNLWFDEDKDQVGLFDHGIALLGERGIPAIQKFDGFLCADSQTHSIAAELRSFHDFDEWHQRIMGIPEWFIRSVVSDAIALGINADESKDLCDFLISRRRKLRRMFHDNQGNKNAFPKISGNLFAIKADPNDYDIEYCI
jgi:hypothetical protein